VAHAINCMLDHIHVMDGKMQSMCEALKSIGLDAPEGERMPDLESCEIVSSAEMAEREAVADSEDVREHLKST
jgi:serine O-acetyltransferase